MYRIIKCDEYVLIGFDNIEEAKAYWTTFGFNKNKNCSLYSSAGNEASIKKEMPYSLSALDHFSLSGNCMAFIDMPRKFYDKVRHRIENCC